jgi:hypothetical protein
MWLTDGLAEAALASAGAARPDSVSRAVKTAAVAALLAWDFFIPDLPPLVATSGDRLVLAQSPETTDPPFVSKH